MEDSNLDEGTTRGALLSSNQVNFSRIGLVVPDVDTATAPLESFAVETLENLIGLIDPGLNSYHGLPEEFGVGKSFEIILAPTAFALDPDGSWDMARSGLTDHIAAMWSR